MFKELNVQCISIIRVIIKGLLFSKGGEVVIQNDSFDSNKPPVKLSIKYKKPLIHQKEHNTNVYQHIIYLGE